MNEQLKIIAKGAGFVFVGMIFSKIFTYLWRWVIAYFLGSDAYGIFSIALAVFGIATTVSLMGLGSSGGGVGRFASYYLGKGDKARVKGVLTSSLKITLILSLVVGVGIFLFSDYIAINIFKTSELSKILKLFSLFLPLAVFSEIFIAFLTAFKKIEYVVFSRDIVGTMLKVALAAIPIGLGFGLWGVSVGFVTTLFFIFAILGYFIEFKVFPIIRTSIKSVFIYRDLLKYSLPLILGSILSTQTRWIDTIILGFFMTPSDVGIYNVALPTATLMLIIPMGILSLFLPTITSHYARNESEKIKITYLTVTKWVAILNMPLFLMLLLFSGPILRVLFGSQYANGGIALSILAFGYFIFSMSWSSSYILNMLKKTHILLIVTSIAFTVDVILNFALIPILGINGAAIATSSSIILSSTFSFLIAYKITNIFPLNRKTLEILFISLFSVLLVYFVTLQTGQRLLVQMSAFLIISFIYVTLLFKYKLIGKEEVEIFKKALKKIGIKI